MCLLAPHYNYDGSSPIIRAEQVFPLETLIFELIVLAILNYIRPHLGRHFLKADALLSKIIFMVAQEFSPSNERGCKVCSIFRNYFVKLTNIPASSCMKLSKGKKDFCRSRSHLDQNQTSLGKRIFKTQPQSGRQVTLFLSSLGFISTVFITSDRNQIPTSLILLCNNELLAHKIRN